MLLSLLLTSHAHHTHTAIRYGEPHWRVAHFESAIDVRMPAELNGVRFSYLSHGVVFLDVAKFFSAFFLYEKSKRLIIV